MSRFLVLGAATLAWATASVAHEAIPTPADGHAFVLQLRQAAAQPGGAALADLTQLPFLFEGSAHQRGAFIAKVVPALFTAGVRQCLQRVRPQAEGDRLVMWCKPYAFYAGTVQGRWRLIEFGTDAE